MPRRLQDASDGKPEPKETIKPQRRARSLARRERCSTASRSTSGSRAWRSSIASFELYSRDAAGARRSWRFDVGQGTQDLGFRNEVNLLFDCEPAVEVTLEVLDDDGKPTTGQFCFAIRQGRVYPATVAAAGARLLLSRADLSPQRRSVLLPPGKYEVTYARGPEYRVLKREIDVPDAGPHNGDVSAGALDQAGRPRLVLGRSSRPRGRLRALRIADRRRRSRST